jgi:hypothetical protein
MARDKGLVRIGGASGFWGDSATAAPQLLADSRLDFLSFDYLAEVTLSLLARARAKDPAAGYATDFVTGAMASILPSLARRRVRVLSNAGGMNPRACAAALELLAAQAGVTLRIAVVEGDDLMSVLPSLDTPVVEMFSGARLPAKLVSANAYLGAFPIAAALDAGADVVITGRCVDSALALGALIHEFEWGAGDLDELAAGSLVGHILECGAQATGGLHTDWRNVPGWENIGYPIAECRPDGSFLLTKPQGTGGLIDAACVAEQMLYEVGDPGCYVLPDVSCDFRAVTIQRVDDEHVEVRGAIGRPAPAHYKCSLTYQEGWRASAVLTIIGREAAQKARRTGHALLARAERMLQDRDLPPIRDHDLQIIGAESVYGPHARRQETREVVMRLVLEADDPRSLDLIGREIAQAGTSWATGTTNALIPGRPKAAPVVRMFSCLIPKDKVSPRVSVAGRDIEFSQPAVTGHPAPSKLIPVVPELAAGGPERIVPLIEIAYARSGDKGDTANIGVIARRPELLPVIRRELTAARVAEYFAYCVKGSVTRYDAPGIHAVNFVLDAALAGGGTASTRLDPLAKGFAQMLLDLPIAVPESLLGAQTQ